MQQQTTVVCPKPTDQQVQAQIENMHWQQKENSLTNEFNRQNTLQVQRTQHQQFMVDHLAQPITFVFVAAIIALTVWFLVRESIRAGIQKNRDDNASDVRRAQEILDKNEGISE